MIKLFRNAHPFHVLLLLGITVILRFAYMAHLPAIVPQPLTALLQQLLVTNAYQIYVNPFNSVIAAGIIVFVQALLFNIIINKYNILGKQTYLPAMFFIICCSVLSPFLTLSLPLLANFILLYIFNKILSSYKQANAITIFFDIGLAIGLSTIVYFPLLLLLLWVWLCLIVLRPFYWREWLSPVIAFLLTPFFLLVFYYYNERLNLMLRFWQPLYSPLKIFINVQVSTYWPLLPLFIVLVLGFVQLRLNFFKTFVLVRKTFIVLLLLAILIIFSFYINPAFSLSHFTLLAIPVATLCAYYFLNARLKWIYEILFYLILIFVIYFQWTG
ncbi:MAG: beta-carotene 15,15'-monooxygenase [Sphingobacteriales bacterium]|nr:MAG: beta-carotene 15,15'-monooxygenase [Sphingobacteriales bacterium]TAF80592.1 MAG: beta-carotene 15,15'-monooxygenase [Sphingobacteriales bacterium]